MEDLYNDPTIDKLLTNPAVPYWIKDLVRVGLTKDPVDAANWLPLVAEAFIHQAVQR